MSHDKGDMPLKNAQHERFCQEYLIDLNATQAAVRAGYSVKTARSIGQRLLTIVDIDKRVASLMAEREKRTQITQDRVLAEFAAIGFTNFTDLASWNEDTLSFTPSDELEENAKRSVKSVKSKRTIRKDESGETITVEMEVTQHDKLSALDKLAKHLNLYGEHGDDSKRSGLDKMIDYLAERRAEREREQ